jgi:hypothetical protein
MSKYTLQILLQFYLIGLPLFLYIYVLIWFISIIYYKKRMFVRMTRTSQILFVIAATHVLELKHRGGVPKVSSGSTCYGLCWALRVGYYIQCAAIQRECHIRVSILSGIVLLDPWQGQSHCY